MSTVLIKAILTRLKRDPFLLVLTLSLGPFFVILYKLIFLQGMTLYEVIIVKPDPEAGAYIEDFIDEMEQKRYPGGAPLFEFKMVENEKEGREKIQNHDAHILLVFNMENGTADVQLVGDFSNPYFVISSQLTQNQLKDYIISKFGFSPPLSIDEIAMGNSGSKSEFESYIPGLIIFSVLSLLYLFSILLVKESASNVFYRYRMAGIGGMKFVISYSLPFLLLSMLAVSLTLITAFILGFHSAISPALDFLMCLLVCALLSLSTIGISFIIASLSSNSMHAFQATTFPFMILVFFSGSVYPFPKIVITEIGRRSIGLFDILPSTHGVNALSKILTFGVKPAGMAYELILLVLLSVILYLAGTVIFFRKRLG